MARSKKVVFASFGAVAFLGIFALPGKATLSVFDFITQSPVNSTVPLSFPSSPVGLQLNVSNPVSIAPPTTGGLNTNSSGLCAWLNNNNIGERCGYTLANGATLASQLSGLQFSFDSNVTLKSFNIGQFTGISGGSIRFQSGGLDQTLNISNTGDVNFTSPFYVPIGQAVTLTTTAILAPSNGSGNFRIQSFTVDTANTAASPGPLPILGAAVGFRFCRQIRKRISSRPFTN
jgi:hypothetical protein